MIPEHALNGSVGRAHVELLRIEGAAYPAQQTLALIVDRSGQDLLEEIVVARKAADILRFRWSAACPCFDASIARGDALYGLNGHHLDHVLPVISEVVHTAGAGYTTAGAIPQGSQSVGSCC